MIRTQIMASSDEVSFNIPENYIGKIVEIIAFTKDEGLDDTLTVKKQPRFNTLHVGQDFKFNRDEANER